LYAIIYPDGGENGKLDKVEYDIARPAKKEVRNLCQASLKPKEF